MAHEIRILEDGILRIALIGDQDEKSMEAFLQDLTPFLETATEEEPLRILTDSSRSGKYTVQARRMYFQIGYGQTVEKVAIVGASRYTRVLVGFIFKGTGQRNVRFFDTESEALVWLKE